jgi:hypothetical protein
MPKSYPLQAPKNQAPSGARLRACKLGECEARCCYDGVYLDDGEEAKINEVVASSPRFFSNLPADFIVDGTWGDGRVTGRKTAVKHTISALPIFPPTFLEPAVYSAPTTTSVCFKCLRCSVACTSGRTSPQACWMFPMDLDDGKPAPPPSAAEPDPQCLGEEYPGFVKFVPCGQDRPDGDPWDQTLADEIDYWRKIDSQ